ncbi:MAG: 3-oxoacyl-[acyl-carrier-protein] synthase III C-terminal domain-containing protein [Bacteriovoracia bacterium]
MNKEVFIHSFRPVLPEYQLPQEKIVKWTLQGHQRYEEISGRGETFTGTRLLSRFALSEKHIRRRFFDCPEVDEEWEGHDVYRLTEKTREGATFGEKNLYFNERVQRVFHELYEKEAPSHIIHVTCTGYLSPSPPQVFFAAKDIKPSITHAYHMGCYASLPAIRIAKGLFLSEGQDVDIVHTELCSLHLDPAIHTPEQIVVQTLFADGHIKYSVGGNKKGFRILAIVEKLLPASGKDMTWIPDSHGMKMGLSRDVPYKIRENIHSLIEGLSEKTKIPVVKILKEASFAIHPGGPKIIEEVQKKLELKDSQVKESKRMLFERGNMSSATLPHVWNELWNKELPDKTLVVSLAFGPGLTVFGSVFEVRS